MNEKQSRFVMKSEAEYEAPSTNSARRRRGWLAALNEEPYIGTYYQLSAQTYSAELTT